MIARPRRSIMIILSALYLIYRPGPPLNLQE